jgi:ketosteroid isomerase-like protein
MSEHNKSQHQWLNLPETVAQVRAVFARYEAALLAHDVQAINSFFLDSAATVRLGIEEHGYGIDAIRAYRRRAPAVAPNRRLQHTTISTIGSTAASVTTEFVVPGDKKIGRQTQTWALTADGWKIVAAHVSEASQATLRRD